MVDEGLTVQAVSDDPGGGAGPARRLGREQILREAVRLIDEHGRDQLTMRRLGAELGVEAMALYRYIPGREQLLDGVVEYVMDELYQATTAAKSAASWPHYLEQVAHHVRDVAIRHPHIFPLIATRPPSAPWLRPPLRSLRWVEGFLTALAGFGFGRHDSVVVYRAFATFLLGQLLLEVATLTAAPVQPGAGSLDFYEPSDPGAYPRLMELSSLLSEDTFDDEFDDALGDLISRIKLLPR